MNFLFPLEIEPQPSGTTYGVKSLGYRYPLDQLGRLMNLVFGFSKGGYFHKCPPQRSDTRIVKKFHGCTFLFNSLGPFS